MHLPLPQPPIRHSFALGSVTVTCERWEEAYSDGECERGARVEIRRGVGQQIGLPVWRADLFALAGGRAPDHERVHYHRRFQGWSQGPRYSSAELRARPVAWVMQRL